MSDKNCGWCKLPGNLFYDEDFSMWLCLDCCQKVDSTAPILPKPNPEMTKRFTALHGEAGDKYDSDEWLMRLTAFIDGFVAGVEYSTDCFLAEPREWPVAVVG